MRIRRLCLALCVLLVCLAGCAPQSKGAPRSGESVIVEKALVEAPAEAPPRPAAASGSYGGKAQDASVDLPERMIIRTAEMSMVVQDTDETLAAMRELIKGYDGYIADSSRWLADEQPYARITLRVPSQSLDEVMALLREMAIKVDNENISGQDVTEEFVDLQARLRNLEATEKELLALLTEVRENRGKAEDILAIHRELTNIRGQIESLKGRAQYLERMTALATINVSIQPKAAPRPLVESTKWNPLVTINNALRGFVRFFQVLADLLIYVVVFSPFILAPVLVIWLFVRWIRRRRNR